MRRPATGLRRVCDGSFIVDIEGWEGDDVVVIGLFSDVEPSFMAGVGIEAAVFFEDFVGEPCGDDFVDSDAIGFVEDVEVKASGDFVSEPILALAIAMVWFLADELADPIGVGEGYAGEQVGEFPRGEGLDVVSVEKFDVDEVEPEGG